jgi:hypothetical protein
MKVIVARSNARFDNIWAQPYVAKEFEFDQQNYELRKKYPPEGVDGEELAEKYKKQTPEERAEEFATDIVTKEGTHQLESVVIVDVEGIIEYTVTYWNRETRLVDTEVVDNLYDIVQDLDTSNIEQNIVYERFEILNHKVITVKDGEKVVYDNTDVVKNEVLKYMGFEE